VSRHPSCPTVDRLLEHPAPGELFLGLPQEQRRRLATLACWEALLAACAVQRHDNPARAVAIAWAAVAVAAHLDRDLLGAGGHADILARSWAELGNSYRVAGRLHSAEVGLRRAGRLCQRGTGDHLLRARLAELTASLRCDQRRFAEVFRELKVAEAIHRERGDDHDLGRILLQKGIYSGYDGDAEGSLEQLCRAWEMIDRERDPLLTLSVVHNLCWMLVENGKVRKARNFLAQHRDRYRSHGGAIDRLKLRWLEARIALGLHDLRLAEELLSEVRAEFDRQGLCYYSALVGLDLAALWVRQRRRPSEVFALVDELLARFREVGVEREALASLLLLREQVARRGELVAERLKMAFLTLQQMAAASRAAAA
jgi:hypothetical protein